MDYEPLSSRERWVVLKAVAVLWGLITVGVAMCVLGGMADKLNWAELRRPLEDPSGWTVKTTHNDGRVTERQATDYDMAERQYAPFVVAGLGVAWTTGSLLILSQGLRRRRTALTRWALRQMGEAA
jgi:hypothetical protein